jgi:hypothetical protein
MQLLNSDKIRNDAWYKEWRTVGAYVFFLISLFDFIGGPIGCMLITIFTKTPTTWTPLTVQGGGLFYFAYGGILGISAYGRLAENKEMLKFVGGDGSDPPADTDKKK